MHLNQSTWSADDKAHVSPRGVTAPGVPSASKHTPGPWRTKRGMDQMCDSGTTVASIVDAPNGPRWWIFSDANNHGDAVADARLIASAPALLALVEQAFAIRDRMPASWVADAHQVLAAVREGER